MVTQKITIDMSKALATKNVAAVLLGLGLVLAFAFAVATPAKADAVSDLQAQVQALLAQITSLQGGSSTTTTTAAGCYTFTRNQKMGDVGGEVMWVQQFLNNHGAMVAASGAGSKGSETSSFGGKTKAAVMAWQSGNGVTPASGYWGPLTRAKANAVCAGSTGTTGGTTGGTTSGVGITVAAAAQPANSLAPKGAVRVPFTNFTLSNNTGVAVTVNGVTVQRTGLGQDAAFAGVVLVDSNNVQVGTSKTLNSNHQAIVGDTFTLMPGETKTLTVAGNMQSSLAAYTGQVVGLSVVGVNTTATVAGSLPITGAQQTLNDTLAVGTVTSNISTFDPNGNQSKNIGDTNLKFTGVRFTAGSAEDLKLYSVRFRQVGSIGSSDLANMVVIVDGVSYPTMVSADGKYYTATFPGGLLIQKGFTKDVYLQGDVVGGNASGRYAEFDIDKTSDVYIVGQLYGYGIAPANGSGTLNAGSGATASNHSTNITATQPWFQGSTFSITGASVTTVAKANEVPAQNVAVNVPNQVLGGYVFDLKGENLSVQSQVFHIATTSGSMPSLMTSVSLVDENGAVVAGPVDAVADGVSGQKVTFTDTVTYPTGRHVYTLKGKIASGTANNTAIVVSTASTDWTNITGATTGNTVALSFSSVPMNAMTVKAASLAVTVSSTPSAQTIVSGGQGTLFANVQFDASQSGEDVRFSSFSLTASTSATGLSATNAISTCQVFDGATALNTGSNVSNPTLSTSAYTAASVSLTLDNSVTVAKGTVKTLAVKCNIAPGATGSIAFGITSAQVTAISATGVTSSNTVVSTGSTNNGQVMTLTSGGSLTVSNSSSMPSYTVQAGGSTGVVGAIYKARATNEDINVTEIALSLAAGTYAGTAASDIVQATVYQGTTAIGTVTFTGGNTVASTTLSTPFKLVKSVDTDLTVKLDIASIGQDLPAGAGDTIKVDVASIKGTGAASGNTIYSSGSTSASGVKIQKSFPVFTYSTAAATANNGVNDLLVLNVAANSSGDGVALNKLTFTIATTTANVTALTFAGPSGNVSSTTNVILNGTATAVTVYFDSTSNTADRVIGPGQNKTYTLRGTVALTGNSGSTGSVSVALKADTSAVANGTAFAVSGVNVWSPNSTTSPAATSTTDWTNSYGLLGCFVTSGLGNDCTARTLAK